MRAGIFAILSGALLLCCGQAEAASFDCKKATTAIERLICEEPNLDSLDTQLDGAYRGALDRSNKPASVKAMQLTWLKERDACAVDMKCMSQVYSRQIEILPGLSDAPASCSGSTTPEMNECAAEYSARADSELGRYVAAARRRLLGEESKEAKGALKEFDASQAAWVAYRKAECGAVYTWWSGGTIRVAIYEECMRSVTKARTLSVWSTWLQYADSTPPLLAKPRDIEADRGAQ